MLWIIKKRVQPYYIRGIFIYGYLGSRHEWNNGKWTNKILNFPWEYFSRTTQLWENYPFPMRLFYWCRYHLCGQWQSKFASFCCGSGRNKRVAKMRFTAKSSDLNPTKYAFRTLGENFRYDYIRLTQPRNWIRCPFRNRHSYLSKCWII